MLREVPRTQLSLLFAGHRQKDDGALRFHLPRFQRPRDLDQRGNTRGVVHCAVENAVAVHLFAHAQMVEMSRKNDAFVLQQAIRTRPDPHNIAGLDLLLRRCDARAQLLHEREVRQRAVMIRGVQNLGDSMARTLEQQVRFGRIPCRRKFEGRFSGQSRIGKRHARLQPVCALPGPGDIHGSRIGDGDGADHPGRLHRRRPLSARRMVRAQFAGYVRRAAIEINGDRALQSCVFQIAVAGLRNVETVAHEHQRRFDPGDVGSGGDQRFDRRA